MGEGGSKDPSLLRVGAEVLAATMIVSAGQVFYNVIFPDPTKPFSAWDAGVGVIVFTAVGWLAIRVAGWIPTPSPSPIEGRLATAARLAKQAKEAIAGVEHEIKALGDKSAYLQELLMTMTPETGYAIRELLLAPAVTQQNRRNLWSTIGVAVITSVPLGLVGIMLSIPATRDMFASWFPSLFAPH